MKQKSLKLNMLLNMIKSFTSIVFPLISFPYVSKILGVESLGAYNFSTSVITYIALLAALGIDYYAVREGAKVRDDKEKFSEFVHQVFSINLISTIFSYLVLGGLIIFVPKFFEYRVLLLILGSQVLFTTLGVNWIFSIYEEYTYITVRSIIVQFVSVIAMFLFIKTEEDVWVYATITVIASVGSNIFNFFFSRRYCNLKFTLHIDWKAHLKPILVLFGMGAAATVYANSDMIMLGFMKGEYSVGIYSVSMKIHTIIKLMLSSAVLVSIPRLSMLLGQKRKDEANAVASNVYATLMTLVVPGICGLIVLSREVVIILSDEAFGSAIYSHIILCFAMFFALGSYFWGQAVLVPSKKEHVVLKVTIWSAVVNIILNCIFIPIFSEVAAAFTTLIAELIGFIWNYREGHKCVQIKGTLKILLKIMLGCIPIIVCSVLLKCFIESMILYTVTLIVISALLYAVIEIVLKNEAVYEIYSSLKSKLKRQS